MNLHSIKSLSEIHLDGMEIEWTKEDKNIKEVRIRDGNGGQLVIRAGTYGDILKLMIPKPFDQEDRWLLKGRFLNLIDVSEHFDDEYAAKERLREYERRSPSDDTGLSIEKVKVSVNDAGEVVPDAGG